MVAQNEAANWYFGQNAGITFDDSGNLVGAVNDGLLETLEGCTSISDVDGNLLFYTDGNIVYNRNHQLMPNGTGLFGDSSSTQSALVVPQPGSDSIYFIFTVDSAATDGIDEGFNYSVVDITLDGGLGDIISKNSPLLNKCSEKITAVLKDCGSGSIWVITLAAQNGIGGTFNTYHAFEITTTGINTTSVKSTFPINIGDPRGQIKVSPNGEKFISANMQNGLYLYDFDANTGTLSNQQSLIIVSTSPSPYGVEFSQNSSKLYVHSTNNAGASAPASSHRSTLTQFDLLETDIQSSAFVLDQQSLYRGSLQLAANGKIYRALSANYQTGLPALGVIDNPNEQGAAATYIHNAIDLSPGLSTQGLPPFIQSFFNDQIDIIQNGENSLELSLCEGETYTLSYADLPGAIYTWTKDGVTQSNTTFEFEISESGYYTLNVEFNNGDCEVFDGEATVTFYEVPIANTAPNLGICDDDNDGSWQFDFTTQDATVFGVQDSSRFEIKYFQTQSDADNNNDGNDLNGQVSVDLLMFDSDVLNGQDASLYNITYHSSQAEADVGSNPIASPYYNVTPFTEEIFVRIENILNTNCFDTTSFNLIVNPLPTVFDALIFQCDYDGNPDGFTLFNLTEASGEITANDPNLSTQFYLSEIDAENATNVIDGTSFSNTVNPQIINVRVINNTTGCYRLAELTLDVSATSVNDAEIFKCDDDGTEDGFVEFDLSEADAAVLGGSPPGITLVYYQTAEDALLEINPLNTNFTNTQAYFQTIYVRAENDNDCYGINEVELTVYELPDIDIEDQTIYCLNNFPETITIDAGLTTGNPNDFNYLWSTGEDTYEININEVGTYTVEIGNNNSCSKSRTITVLPSNIATISNIDVIDATSNNTITIIVSGEGDYEFAIDNISGPYQDSNLFENVSPGLHDVYIRDKNNCGIVQELVSVIGFPKFFTPNNDGYNDTWQVYGINVSSQQESIIYVFDRFGKLVKQLSPSDSGWDGTFNGQPLPSSDYWFHIKLQDGRTFKSHFTLKR